MAGGFTERSAVTFVPPCVAVIVADWVDPTAKVETVNVAEVEPCATVTVPGTVAFELFDEREIVEPPDGAGPLNVTVPVVFEPPITEFGVTLTDANPEFEIVSVAVADLVPDVAVMMAVPLFAVSEVTIGKVTVVEAFGTITKAGTVADVELLVRVTTSPPTGAKPASVTVPVELPPEETTVGFRDRPVTEIVFTWVPIA